MIGLALFVVLFHGGIFGMVMLFGVGVLTTVLTMRVSLYIQASKECALCYAARCAYHENANYDAV